MSEANKKQVGGQHYKGGIDHWDFIVANDVPYLEAQIIKYVFRHAKKNGIQDLEKAQHFLEKLIEVEGMKARGQRMVVDVVASAKCCGSCARWGTGDLPIALTAGLSADRKFCPEYRTVTNATEMWKCDRYAPKD